MAHGVSAGNQIKMHKTPTSSKSRRLSHEKHAELPDQYSPVLVSPGRSPIQGQLNGPARKVKDTCADLHAAVQKWEALNSKGMKIITEIANMKLQVIEREENEVSLFPDGLQKLCDDLTGVSVMLEKVVSKMEQLSAALKGVADLEWHQENGSFCEEPLFQTWTTEIFSQTSEDLVSMYKKELSVKKSITQSVAHATSHQELLFYSASWLHQPYIDNKSSLLLESMLCETGLR